MLTYVVWLSASVLLLSVSLSSYLLWDRRQKEKEVRGVISEQSKLIDKLTVLLSTKDPLAFQAVQAMGQVPYNEGLSVTTASEEEDDYEEPLNGYESSAFRDLFG